MKAYLISTGSYSDYRIVTVFLDKDEAEKYVKDNNVQSVTSQAKSSWVWVNDPPNGIVPGYNKEYIMKMRSISLEDFIQEQIKERLVDNEWGECRIEEFDVEGTIPQLVLNLMKEKL